MQKLSDKLGGIIKTARLSKYMTKKQLATRLSISPYHLKALENSIKRQAGDLLFHIIRELEISAETVFYPEYTRQ